MHTDFAHLQYLTRYFLGLCQRFSGISNRQRPAHQKVEEKNCCTQNREENAKPHQQTLFARNAITAYAVKAMPFSAPP